MHLHAHPAKGKDEYSLRSWTPLALDMGDARATSVMRSQSSAIQGDAKSASNL